jgi:hypothetical protein
MQLIVVDEHICSTFIGALVARSARCRPARLMTGVCASGHCLSLMALGEAVSRHA